MHRAQTALHASCTNSKAFKTNYCPKLEPQNVWNFPYQVHIYWIKLSYYQHCAAGKKTTAIAFNLDNQAKLKPVMSDSH